MHPALRTLGNLLRLVGISSPEDTEPHPVEPLKPYRSSLLALGSIPHTTAASTLASNPPAAAPPRPPDNSPSV